MAIWVAIVGAVVQALLAAKVAALGPAAPGWVYLAASGAALLSSAAVNIATAGDNWNGGSVPELVRAAWSGAHRHGYRLRIVTR